MQKGFQNEEDFVKAINNHKYGTLSKTIQELLLELFGSISKDEIILCWRSKYLEKADIKIRIKGELKGISIKSGYNCSIHQEHISKFSDFLEKVGLDMQNIITMQKFLEGYHNGLRIDAKSYIKYNEKSIYKLISNLNDYYIKACLIIRFIFQGTEIQKYDCDALIYGTPNNFFWATKSEILKYLLNYPIKYANYISISALNIKAYDRNLRNNPKKMQDQQNIQVKWYSLKEDLEYLTKIREAKQILISTSSSKSVNN